MPKNSNFRLMVIGFSQKMEVTKSRWDPLGSIVGPMGSHWVQKMGQNRKKLPCPKIRIFDYPGHRFFHAPKFEFSSTLRSSTFPKKWKLRLWRQITVGTP